MDFTQILKDYLKNRFQVITEEDEEGVDGVDVLPDEQESAIDDADTPPTKDTQKIVDLANLLLQSFRFEITPELKAYLLMPKFRKKSPFEKLTWVRNILLDNPEKIVEEAEGDEETGEAPEFGVMDELEIDEVGQKDLLRLIVRALRANPHSYSYTIKKLPTEASEDNYAEIVDTIERSLF